MAAERPELNRLEVLRALKISNWEAVYSTVHATLTGGAFQTGYALWLGASNLWMGVLASFPTFSGLIQIISSYMVEKRGERKWFTAWLSGTARFLWFPILLLPFLLPPGLRFPAFAILLLLSSLLISMPGPAFTSWMSDLVPPDHRGRYFGRRNMLAGITTMVVSLPAAWFLDLAVKRHLFSTAVGFAGLFGIAVLCGIASFYCLTRQAEPPMQRSDIGSAQGLKGLIDFYRPPFSEPNFRKLMFFSTVFAGAQFFAAPFYIVYALQVLKLNYVWLQIFATLASIASLLSMPLWGYLSDKFGNRPLLIISVFGTGLLPVIWVFTSPKFIAASIILACINNFLGGLFWAGVNLTQFNFLISSTPAERKSVYVGAMSAVTGVVGGVAPIIGGMLLTALTDVHIRPLGWSMGNYQILFAINGLLRFSTLFALGRVSDTGSASPKDVLTQLGTARVGGWVQMRRLQRSQSESGRRLAAQALRSARTALAVEELITALDDPSQHVREEAAEALGEIGDPRAVDALINHLTDPASGIVDESALALGRIGDDRAIGPLAVLLKSGEKPDRVAAAKALGRIGSEAGVSHLLAVIQEGDIVANPEVAEASVIALGLIGSPEAVPTLIQCIQHPSRSLRLTAVRSLGDIADSKAEDSLLELLHNEADPAIIAHIAVALAMMDTPDAIGPLLNSMDRVESPVARKQILNAVGSLMGEGEAFYPLLAQEHFARDEAIARILKEMGRSERAEKEEFGSRRRVRQMEKALEHYMEGDYSTALNLVARQVDREGDDPAVPALNWALETMERRPLDQEEFLLALFAVRRLMG
jgi:HEAT repeat protein/Na+/melibiose symporter-like transporter